MSPIYPGQTFPGQPAPEPTAGDFVHSFSGVTPPARFDGTPWTSVLVYQSATATTGALVQTLSIPVDATPDTPNPVNLTVTLAPFEVGYFVFRFRDASLTLSPASAPILSPSGPAASGFDPPTVEQVAALLRARTTNQNGSEVGTFTDDGATRPSRAQVLELAAQGAGDVAARIGFAPLTGSLPTLATSLSALRTAMLVELSYFPEQIESGQSPYEQLRDMYTEQLGYLADSVDGDAAGTENRLTQVRMRSVSTVPRSSSDFGLPL